MTNRLSDKFKLALKGVQSKVKSILGVAPIHKMSASHHQHDSTCNHGNAAKRSKVKLNPKQKRRMRRANLLNGLAEMYQQFGKDAIDRLTYAAAFSYEMRTRLWSLRKQDDPAYCQGDNAKRVRRAVRVNTTMKGGLSYGG